MPKLKADEFICDKCNGNRNIKKVNKNMQSFSIICPKCLGKGSVDWIENIMGKSPTNFDGYYFSISDIENCFEQEYFAKVCLDITKTIDKDIINGIITTTITKK